MKNSLLIFLLFLLTACNYSLIPENETLTSRIVVTSFFAPDSFFKVKVEPLTDAFTSTSDSIMVNEIKLTNQTTGQVGYLEKEDGSESVYTTDQLLPKPGNVYKLEVLTNVSKVPVVAIDSISNIIQSFKLIDTKVTVKDYSEGIIFEWNIDRTAKIMFLPDSEHRPLYLELAVFKNDYIENIYGEFIVKSGEYKIDLRSPTSFVTSEDYYPSITSMEAFYPQSLLFKCPSTDDSVTVEFSYNNSTAASMVELISAAHDLRIELRTVSYAYYKYKTALYKQKNAIRGDIIYGAAPPVKIPTNVENGTGVFAGYNTTVYKTHIDKYIYKRK